MSYPIVFSRKMFDLAMALSTDINGLFCCAKLNFFSE